MTTNTAFSDGGNTLHNTTIRDGHRRSLVENSEIILLASESLLRAAKDPAPTA